MMTSTEGLEHSEPPQNGFGSNTNAKESNSDIDNMFFVCTICDDTSSVPTQSMLTTFPTNSTKKKRHRSKMVFISDFTENDYGEKKDEHGNTDDYDHKSNNNNNSNICRIGLTNNKKNCNGKITIPNFWYLFLKSISLFNNNARITPAVLLSLTILL